MLEHPWLTMPKNYDYKLNEQEYKLYQEKQKRYRETFEVADGTITGPFYY